MIIMDAMSKLLPSSSGQELEALGWGGIEKEYIIIRVVPPGQGIPSGGRGDHGNFVALPKVGSDLAYDLKPGEIVVLTGGTKPLRCGHTLTPFLANSIIRLK
jgi:hypothetical protein